VLSVLRKLNLAACSLHHWVAEGSCFVAVPIDQSKWDHQTTQGDADFLPLLQNGVRRDLAVMRCLSICLSVCLSRFYILSKRINMSLNCFYRTMLCKRGLCCHAVSVCLSVCLSVTFVHHVKTNKTIFKIFSPSGSDTVLVFPHQRGCRYSDGNSPNGGFECKGVW